MLLIHTFMSRIIEELFYVAILVSLTVTLFVVVFPQGPPLPTTSFEPSRGTVLQGEFEFEEIQASYVVNAAGNNPLHSIYLS